MEFLVAKIFCLFVVFMLLNEKKCKINGLSQVNKELIRKIKLNPRKDEMYVSFNDGIFEEPLDLTNLEMRGRKTKQIKLMVKRCNGFNLNMNASFLNISNETDQSLVVEFHLFFFEFYKNSSNKYKKIDHTSTKEILNSYYYHYHKSNGKELVDYFNNFIGLFAIARNFFFKVLAKSYFSTMSKLIFKNASIEDFRLFAQENTTLRRYFLEFVDDVFNYTRSTSTNHSQSNLVKLSSHIKSVNLVDSYNVCVNRPMLDPDVFEELVKFKISGMITKIEEDIFKWFDSIRKVLLEINNCREFLHSTSDNKWMRWINHVYSMDLSRFKNGSKYPNQSEFGFIKDHFAILSIDDRYDNYDYPNEDLCLLRYFQSDHLVFYKMAERSNQSLIRFVDTCTLYHLTKYSFIANSTLTDDLLTIFVYKSNISVDCDLDSLFSHCNLSKFYPINSITIDDFQYFLKWFELIGPIITLPIVSFIGIITNVLVIATIKSKKNDKIINENENSKRMFKYLTANSVFNLIECVVCVFTLMNECLGFGSVYCSSLLTQEFAIHFKVYIICYFGEAMKTCSVLLTLLFSLERYKITANENKNRLLNRIAKTRLRVIILVCLVISFATCVNKIFEFDNSYVIYSSIQFPDLQIVQIMEKPKERAYFLAFYLTHYILNDAILLLVNFLCDIFLVIIIRKDLNSKKILFAKFNGQQQPSSTTSSSSPNSEQSKKEQEKYNSILKAEKNTNKMIVYTFLMYLMCRFPELILYIFMILPSTDNNKSNTLIRNRFMRLAAPSAINTVEYLYIISYTLNLFFYHKFNKKFQNAFKNLFK